MLSISYRRITRLIHRYRIPLFLALAFFFLETIHHARTAYTIPRPSIPLDPPFHDSCLDPVYSAANTPRQSAALVMLARNDDVDGAVTAVRSIEAKFNRHFKYPYVFLNNKPWSSEFQTRVTAEVSGAVEFAEISAFDWGWSTAFEGDEKEKDVARANWARMDEGRGVRHGSYLQNENYHHMCRFNSGPIFMHPALRKYKWYWRLEPDVEYSCAITYDPFALMATNNKTYGYTIALWEVGSTAPTLFRQIADYAERKHPDRVKDSLTWRAMHDASWAPLPLRHLLLPYLPVSFHSRNSHGDPWNFCHFWSNFEIADMDFFRSDDYQRLFNHLDDAGGFHYERWGDAPVHSLAAALLLEPHQIHYFQDIGYRHPPFQHCPRDEGVGCRCECDPAQGRVPDVCLRRLREAVEPP